MRALLLLYRKNCGKMIAVTSKGCGRIVRTSFELSTGQP
ncbi:hypothetical protein SAMN05216243_3364 [Sediminibacillus albus]|uniref:Uncharacterized protein n=1 Tax=Sediminibacillus albus TaxID=407036 RepID=A0A1G9CBX4_9BACI|nr:hypothetical protein SAMN05216243_3364 [Sediminibacillus albus]